MPGSLCGMTTPRSKPHSESDVPADPASVESRATGGDPNADSPDAVSTTGTGESDEFVGRVAGADEGFEGETGAERRQQAAQER